MAHIIFVHKGWHEYLYYALSQAKASNPGATVHLIGDENNRVFRCLVNHHYCGECGEYSRKRLKYGHPKKDRMICAKCRRKLWL